MGTAGVPVAAAAANDFTVGAFHSRRIGFAARSPTGLRLDMGSFDVITVRSTSPDFRVWALTAAAGDIVPHFGEFGLRFGPNLRWERNGAAARAGARPKVENRPR